MKSLVASQQRGDNRAPGSALAQRAHSSDEESA
jgi:hypothetical protein